MDEKRESNALAIARAYHNAWTKGDFERARSFLNEDLVVEVPVNEYPTVDSFAEALAAFGSQATSTDLIAEFGAREEAMLLYDMTVDGLGKLRIAEHFTVTHDGISRLRQVHDTAPIRAAGGGTTSLPQHENQL